MGGVVPLDQGFRGYSGQVDRAEAIVDLFLKIVVSERAERFCLGAVSGVR